MAAKVKGIFKGIKHITKIFVFKDQEMEIGYPTDVRHVAHIGWDSSSVNGPSWMSEFKATSDFSSAPLTNFGQSRDISWASQDFEQPRGLPSPSDSTLPGIAEVPKKTRCKKMKVSSPSSSTRSSTRSTKTRASYVSSINNEANGIHNQIQVA